MSFSFSKYDTINTFGKIPNKARKQSTLPDVFYLQGMKIANRPKQAIADSNLASTTSHMDNGNAALVRITCQMRFIL